MPMLPKWLQSMLMFGYKVKNRRLWVYLTKILGEMILRPHLLSLHDRMDRVIELNKSMILMNSFMFSIRININDYDIHYLRSCYGVVSQEPVLFNTTIEGNIHYNLENVERKDIEEVSIKSNVHLIQTDKLIEIIEKRKSNQEIRQNKAEMLNTQHQIKHQEEEPEYLKIKVGVKGSQISGGEKQRIAIARMMLRKPQILILDEATSALDNQNTQAILTAIDRISQDKTMIEVTHKLNYVGDDYHVLMLERGNLVQDGICGQLKKHQLRFQKELNLQQFAII